MSNKITPMFLPSSGGYHDSLDGSPLKDGDRLYVRWPAGSTQLIVVATETLYRGAMIDGQVKNAPCVKAFIKVPVIGAVAAKVYLVGFEAQWA